jgi:uncharacterized protein DUF4177
MPHLPKGRLEHGPPLRHASVSQAAVEGHHGGMTQRYEYKVVELREKLLGGKMSGSKLENVLNEHAAEGWRLKAVTSAEVKGRIGPGGVDGILVTFERGTG